MCAECGSAIVLGDAALSARRAIASVNTLLASWYGAPIVQIPLRESTFAAGARILWEAGEPRRLVRLAMRLNGVAGCRD